MSTTILRILLKTSAGGRSKYSLVITNRRPAEEEMWETKNPAEDGGVFGEGGAYGALVTEIFPMKVTSLKRKVRTVQRLLA